MGMDSPRERDKRRGRPFLPHLANGAAQVDETPILSGKKINLRRRVWVGMAKVKEISFLAYFFST